MMNLARLSTSGLLLPVDAKWKTTSISSLQLRFPMIGPSNSPLSAIIFLMQVFSWFFNFFCGLYMCPYPIRARSMGTGLPTTAKLIFSLHSQFMQWSKLPSTAYISSYRISLKLMSSSAITQLKKCYIPIFVDINMLTLTRWHVDVLTLACWHVNMLTYWRWYVDVLRYGHINIDLLTSWHVNIDMLTLTHSDVVTFVIWQYFSFYITFFSHNINL